MRSWSFRHSVIFWWILFLALQQAERFFLLPQALWRDPPGSLILLKTVLTGFRADLIASTIAILIPIIVVGIVALVSWWLSKELPWRPYLISSCVLMSVVLLIILTADMGYYFHNQQRLDFVFFEYLEDLLTLPADSDMQGQQAAQQTVAELGDRLAWALRLLGFFLLEGLAVAAWWLGFKYVVKPALSRYGPHSGFASSVILGVALVIGGLGFHPAGPYAIRLVDLPSATYYTLAQNPILYASDALRASRESIAGVGHSAIPDAMPLDQALQIAQQAIGRGAAFPDPRFPLVRETETSGGVHFDRPANVLLIFLEGLDRRYVGRTIASKGTEPGIRLTAFLDRLKGESLYFENFFANGVQTSRGLFASLCSYYPFQGPAAIKTRYTHDYLCLPSLLQRAGYRTEMVISQHHDINRLQLFMSRNGLHQLLDESDFPKDAEKTGKQITDGALFDRMRSEVEKLQASGRPFFLTTLTVGTHHPFNVPIAHEEVRALRGEDDGYMAALRYVDIEFERFFLGLQRDGLLKNTVVFVLGDHGRHETVGASQDEWEIGHFMAPLFVWLDPSLRTPATYRPRVVSTLASQVDLAPTILALNGLTPRVSAHVGRDLSCMLVRDCAADNMAYLSSVYDDLIALADHDGLLVYSLRTRRLYQTDFTLRETTVRRAKDDARTDPRFRRLLGLYVSSNALLARNQIWSWKEWGKRL